MQDLRSANPDLYAEERYRLGKFYCDLCGDFWPMSHQRTMYGGARVGVLCCYEPEGSSEWRDVKRGLAGKMAAELSAREMEPPRAPDGSMYAGSRAIPDFVAITSHDGPLIFPFGGAVRTLHVTGFGFTAADTYTIGLGGSFLSVAPTINSSTSVDLVITTVGATARAVYNMVFTGADGISTTWPGVVEIL